MEVAFLATLLRKTMPRYQGLHFSVLIAIFSGSQSGLHFYSFFGDFRVAKAPVLELVGLIFRHQKNESKNGLRVYATAREYTRVLEGGVPFKTDNIPPETAFQHQFTPAVPEGTVADLHLIQM